MAATDTEEVMVTASRIVVTLDTSSDPRTEREAPATTGDAAENVPRTIADESTDVGPPMAVPDATLRSVEIVALPVTDIVEPKLDVALTDSFPVTPVSAAMDTGPMHSELSYTERCETATTWALDDRDDPIRMNDATDSELATVTSDM